MNLVFWLTRARQFIWLSAYLPPLATSEGDSCVRLLLQAAIFTMATSTMLLTLAKTYFGVFASAIFFSSADGLMMTSLIVEILKAVKEDEKASAVGLLMLFSGVSSLIKPHKSQISETHL